MANIAVVALVFTAILVSVKTEGNEVSVSHVDIIGYGPRLVRNPEINLFPVYPFLQPQIAVPIVDKFIPFTLFDLYNVPFYYLVKSSTKTSHYVMYYAKNGTRTTHENESFKTLFEYLKSPVEKTGVLYNSKYVINQKLSELPIQSVVYPDNFTIAEYNELSQIGVNCPTLLVYEKSEDLGLELKNTYNVAALRIYDNFIDIIIGHEEHKPKQEKVIKVVNISDDQTKTTTN